MNIPSLIKEAHDNAIERGFYDCSECDGTCERQPKTKHEMTLTAVPCEACNITGINPNRNIGEFLMLIVSELGGALEAHRNNRFADKEAFNDILKLIKGGSKLGLVAHYPQIKNTFEDEIADVFIRLFDLCGYLKIQNVYFEEPICKEMDNIGEMLLYVCKEITNYQFTTNNRIWMAFCLSSVYNICLKLNIPIEKHIKAKMVYNRTRPRKHGKEC